MKRPNEYHLQFKVNKYSLFLSKYIHEVKHSCIIFVFGSNLWGIGGRALFQFLMHITIRVAPRDSSLGIEIKSYSFTFSSLLTTINTVIQMYSVLSNCQRIISEQVIASIPFRWILTNCNWTLNSCKVVYNL